MSKGRLNIELMPGSPLGYKGPEMLRVLQDAGVDIVGSAACGWFGGDLPMFSISDLPMLSIGPNSAYVTTKAGREVWTPMVEKQFDAKIFAWNIRDEQVIYSVDKLIRVADDIKGMKIRCWSKPMGDLISALGGTPVFIAQGEVYPAAQRKVIDGMITGMVAGYANKFPEVGKYFLTDFGISYMVGATIVAGKSFRRLPLDLQGVLLKGGELFEKWNVEEVPKVQKDAIALLEKAGMKRITLPPQEVAKAQDKAKTLWYSTAKSIGPDAEKLLEKVVSAQKQAGFMK